MSETFKPGGWVITDNSFPWFDALPGESAVMAMKGTYAEVVLDPRKIVVVENQGPVGACQGHSISSLTEWCYAIALGGKTIQLSRAYGYYETQRLDGITGDNGSTIEGGIKLATTHGICEEILWPYTSTYNPNRPRPLADLRRNAANYKIKKFYRLKTYDAIRTFLGSGQGGVHIGVPWNSSLEREVVEVYTGKSRGGHSVGLYSLSERKDRSGNPYVWMMNSWGKNWMNGGWAEWSPTAIELLLKEKFSVFIGVSDITVPEPRTFSLTDWRKALTA